MPLTTPKQAAFDALVKHQTSLLGSGELSDCFIQCQGHTFRAHQSIIRRCKFFDSVFGSNWSESETSTVNLPEDDPALIARLLCWLYTSDYPSHDIDSAKIARVSPSPVDDPYRTPEQPDNDVQWIARGRMHQLMAAVADKYDLPDLFQESFRRFALAFCNEGENTLRTPREREAIASDDDLTEVDMALYKGSYDVPGTSLLFKNWVLRALHWHMEAGQPDSRILDTLFTERQDIALDLAITKRSHRAWKCSNCGFRRIVLLRRCACQLLNGCDETSCVQVIQDSNVCDRCFSFSTLKIPEFWPGYP